MKSYTDIEQSKKLAEILPIESADMWYSERYAGNVTENGEYIVSDVPCYYLSLDKPSEYNCSLDVIKDIPCWSLAALLDLLPEGTNISKSTPLDNSEYCCWNQYDEVYADNPVDACYEIIVKFK